MLHRPGYAHVERTASLIGYESQNERWVLLALDHDEPSMTGLLEQPLVVVYRLVGETDPRTHVPDFAFTTPRGTVVVDVTTPSGAGKAAVAHAATSAVCDRRGWEYRVVGPVAQDVRHRLRWLGAYRRPNAEAVALADLFKAAARDGAWVGDALAQARLAVPAPLVQPALMHLLWHQAVRLDPGPGPDAVRDALGPDPDPDDVLAAFVHAQQPVAPRPDLELPQPHHALRPGPDGAWAQWAARYVRGNLPGRVR
jgi:hypothetical protein